MITYPSIICTDWVTAIVFPDVSDLPLGTDLQDIRATIKEAPTEF